MVASLQAITVRVEAGVEGKGANIAAARPAPGMMAYCTVSGSGFTAGIMYGRNYGGGIAVAGVFSSVDRLGNLVICSQVKTAKWEKMLIIHHTISMTNLNYIKLLFIILDASTQVNEFSAKDLATAIPLRFPSDQDALKSSNVKLISNDLARLYRMQFLSRRRIKREVNSGGNLCNRGYMYMYRLNKQGRSYIEYLKATYPYGKDFQDYFKHVAMKINPKTVAYLHLFKKSMADSIEDDDEEYVQYLYRLSDFAKGRYSRFAPRIGLEYLKNLIETKRKLKERNEKLGKKNEKLESKLERLEKRLDKCRERNRLLLQYSLYSRK